MIIGLPIGKKSLKQKAFAYITYQRQLLVFRHVAHPEAGIQVPADTVKPGETPVVAALREAQEETGLDGLTLASYLGEHMRAMTDFEMKRRPKPSLLLIGEANLIVRLGTTIDHRANTQILRLLTALDAHPPLGLIDLIPTYASLLVTFDPLQTDALVMQQAIIAAYMVYASWDKGDAHPIESEARVVHIPVCYGGSYGPDLDDVARMQGMLPDEVIRLHRDANYQVAFLGFLAGFPYLSGLPKSLQVPRLDAPRTLVPAGSVAIAEAQTGIYPVASPGGWRIIGRTPLRLFDPAADPPTLLQAGDRLHFTSITASQYEHFAFPPIQTDGSTKGAKPHERPQVIATAARDSCPRETPASMPWLRIIQPGSLTTVQDRGRWGYARYGISVAGAADPEALQLANILLGNPLNAAALEITLGGSVFEALGPCAIVLTGADCYAQYDGHPLATGRVIALQTGQKLQLGMMTSGLRAYLGVAGGIALAPVLGSRATDMRAGLGGLDGRRLQADDRLDHAKPVIPHTTLVGRYLSTIFARRIPQDGQWSLRVLPGSHAAAHPAMLAALIAGTYTVDSRSDRMGVRLHHDGPVPLRGGQIISEGVPRGAIQLPPGGAPIMVLADSQATGGYIIPAVVIAADQWCIGQMRPGDTVRYIRTTREEAIMALQARAAWLQHMADFYK